MSIRSMFLMPFGIIVLAVLFLVFFGGCFHAPWLPTLEKDFPKIERLLSLKKGEKIYDLGCGTASLLFYLSKKNEIQAVGFEISPLLFLFSKIKSVFYKNVTIRFGNFLNQSFSDADAVYFFLLKREYGGIGGKVEKEIKKDARVVVACWPVNEWKIKEKVEDKNTMPFFLYTPK